MTASKPFHALLACIRRTLQRTARKVTIASATLTFSLPPFFKLEIRTEPARRLRRRRAA